MSTTTTVQTDPRQSVSPPQVDGKADTQSSSPKSASLSTSPSSRSASLRSSSTAPSSTATGSSSTIPTNDEVEAVIKMATSTRPTPDGRPPPGKDTRTQLYAGNLPYRVRWQDLKDLFRRSGTVLRADVSLSPDNRSRGYGTVLLASAEDAGRAVDMFNGYSWQGRILEVRLDRLGAVPGAEMDTTQLGSAALPAAAAASLSGMGVGMGIGGGLSAGLPAQSIGMGMNVGALGGRLQVPSPHTALPLASHNFNLGGGLNIPTTAGTSGMTSTNIPAASAGATSATSGIAQGVSSSAMSVAASLNSIQPSSPIHASFFALQQQKHQRDREMDELLTAHAQSRAQSVMNSNLLGSNLGVSPSYAVGSLANADSFPNLAGRGGSTDFGDSQSRPSSSSGMRSLFVGNLPFHCQWQDLKDLFRQAGTIVRADVSLGPDGRSRGFGTVSFANEIDAERAIALFNGYDYNGRTLKVHYDRFSAQSPLPPQSLSSMSLQHSMNSTPVQPAAASTHAALLQAAQLKQLVNGQSHGGLSDLRSMSQPVLQTLGPSPSTSSALAALHETIASRSSSGLLGGLDKRETSLSSSPVSPLANQVFAFGSSGLAERRKQQMSAPAPIGSGSGSLSASSSRPGTSAGSAMGGAAGMYNVGMAHNDSDLPSLGKLGRAFTSGAESDSQDGSITPEIVKRPAKSMPASSLAIPKATSAKESPETSNPGNSSKPATDTNSSSTSPRTTHPAHPGPISLPPPAPLGPFPMYSPHHAHLQHPMSPVSHPMSPYGYPYGPMTPPIFLPGHMQVHGHNMTPHGLPPITPSMPSFSFVPQPSPGLGMMPQRGSSAIPPTPKEEDRTSSSPEENNSPETHAAANPTATPNTYSTDYTQQHAMQPYPGMGMYAMMSPPLHLPGHVFQPFTPGSTVSAMSPGVFFRPEPHIQGPYMNGAVGSPVMGHPSMSAFYGHPGSQPASPYYGAPMWAQAPHYQQQQQQGHQQPRQHEEYFPSMPAQKEEGYFPPLPPSIGSSGLANEILRDGSTMFKNDLYDGDKRDAAAHALARDVSTLSLGAAGISSDESMPSSVTKPAQSKAQSPSYAAIASAPPNRAESSASSGSSGQMNVPAHPASAPGARHNSMSSSSKQRPTALAKAMSDEGAQGHVKTVFVFSS